MGFKNINLNIIIFSNFYLYKKRGIENIIYIYKQWYNGAGVVLNSVVGLIIHLYFVPWHMINNSTSCDRIIYSTLMCFYPCGNKIFDYINQHDDPYTTLDKMRDLLVDHYL